MKSRRRWGVAAGGLLLALLAGWLAWRQLRHEAEVSLAAAAPAGGASQALAQVWLKPSGEDGAALRQLPASARAAAAANEPDPADEVVEICGLGRVSKRQAQRWNPVEVLRVQAQLDALDRRKGAAMSQLSARLAAGSDTERVAARLVMGDIEGAALTARHSSDPAAYRLGLLGCGKPGAAQGAPGCQGLSNAGWVRLDAEDAEPWLRMAGEALSRRDDAAATEALEQAMQRRKRSTDRPLLQAIVGARGRVDDAVGMGLAVVELVGVEFASPNFSVLALSSYCSAKAVRDPARRDRCERYVRWQFAHAQSLLDAQLALGVADRVGLPADQRPYGRVQLEQASERLLEETASQSGLDCDSIARAADWPARLLQGSELQRTLRPAPEGG